MYEQILFKATKIHIWCQLDPHDTQIMASLYQHIGDANTLMKHIQAQDNWSFEHSDQVQYLVILILLQ